MFVLGITITINFACQCVLIFNDRLARQVPTNYILLAIITFTESYLLSIICAEFTPTSVISIAIITLSAFIGLTFYANTTKRDLTIPMSMMFGCTFMLLGITVVMIFINVSFGFCIAVFFVTILELLFVMVDV